MRFQNLKLWLDGMTSLRLSEASTFPVSQFSTEQAVGRKQPPLLPPQAGPAVCRSARLCHHDLALFSVFPTGTGCVKGVRTWTDVQTELWAPSRLPSPAEPILGWRTLPVLPRFQAKHKSPNTYSKCSFNRDTPTFKGPQVPVSPEEPGPGH